MVLPLPSWPWVLAPQHSTRPSLVMAHVCPPPAVIFTAVAARVARPAVTTRIAARPTAAHASLTRVAGVDIVVVPLVCGARADVDGRGQEGTPARRGAWQARADLYAPAARRCQSGERDCVKGDGRVLGASCRCLVPCWVLVLSLPPGAWCSASAPSRKGARAGQFRRRQGNSTKHTVPSAQYQARSTKHAAPGTRDPLTPARARSPAPLPATRTRSGAAPCTSGAPRAVSSDSRAR